MMNWTFSIDIKSYKKDTGKINQFFTALTYIFLFSIATRIVIEICSSHP